MNSAMNAVLLVLATLLLGACAVTHTSTSKYADGQPRAVYEYKFEDEEEVRHGAYQSWYPNGELRSSGQFADGQRTGEWTYFYATGQKRTAGHYEEGRRVGRWSFWTEEGELHAHVTYPDSEQGEVTREFVGDAPAIGTATPEVGPFCEKRHVKAVVGAFRDELKSCYERELQRDTSLKGKVLQRWKIGTRGEVVSSSIEKTTLENKSVEECLVNVVAKMQFPPPEGGVCVIHYPFVFSRLK